MIAVAELRLYSMSFWDGKALSSIVAKSFHKLTGRYARKNDLFHSSNPRSTGRCAKSDIQLGTTMMLSTIAKRFSSQKKS